MTSQQQQLELELHTLKTTINNVGAYIYIKDTNGCYTYANQKVTELFGCSLEQLVGLDDSYFFLTDHLGDLQENDRKVLEQGIEIEGEERNIVKSTGETRYYWTVKKPLYEEGQVIGMYGISTDITERKLLEKQLHEKQALLDTVLNNIDAYIYMKNSDAQFLYANKKTAKLFGQKPQTLLGKTAEQCLGEEASVDFNQLDKQVLTLGKKVSGQEQFIDEYGETRYYWTTKVPLKNSENEVVSFVGMSTDTTEIIKLKEQYRRLASIDELTQLANRRSFTTQGNSELARFLRHGCKFVILLLDLDYFKNINDSFGHAVGDEVLIAVSNCFVDTVRELDFVSRIGGEEFAIILPKTDVKAAYVIAERIRNNIKKIIVNTPFCQVKNLSISIGLSIVKAEDSELDHILLRADKALYEAKSAGRDCVIEK
ncbi:sensor domain-containing diguanylate cyclase [Pseudoalteromonas tunicata]|uniref:Sensory box/GGDEF domain protein n=1 Tax=Pseudoalteromonas tunicata D2 TaxID=87626 RepID=A4C9E8_9GAMM|nr:sensor domain-containing diguanylate cyclase [Pseudoalteromonas tunicata]ATC93717.1 hypothetical protein PTUN_a1021 [Pseudoalteromonas tunicata]AXT29544.1 diguanylate cyclase [Pseudoalteromonas tunicata]EAR29213.1 sensory box/GGDEF domain protein [Pseudoalteromonas tunicata D2]MDP4982416.1 sensor domain-containing diguanylate cyclase [Pseudoalteromonas tunicata]